LKQSIYVYVRSVKETQSGGGGGSPLLGPRGNMWKKALVSHLFPWGLHLGTWKGARVPGTLMDETDVSVRAPLGNLGSDPSTRLWI